MDRLDSGSFRAGPALCSSDCHGDHHAGTGQDAPGAARDVAHGAGVRLARAVQCRIRVPAGGPCPLLGDEQPGVAGTARSDPP